MQTHSAAVSVCREYCRNFKWGKLKLCSNSRHDVWPLCTKLKRFSSSDVFLWIQYKASLCSRHSHLTLPLLNSPHPIALQHAPLAQPPPSPQLQPHPRLVPQPRISPSAAGLTLPLPPSNHSPLASISTHPVPPTPQNPCFNSPPARHPSQPLPSPAPPHPAPDLTPILTLLSDLDLPAAERRLFDVADAEIRETLRRFLKYKNLRSLSCRSVTFKCYLIQKNLTADNKSDIVCTVNLRQLMETRHDVLKTRDRLE